MLVLMTRTGTMVSSRGCNSARRRKKSKSNRFSWCCFVLLVVLDLSSAFPAKNTVRCSRCRCCSHRNRLPLALATSASSGSVGYFGFDSGARDLLYQDQQNAMERRALVEEELLLSSLSTIEELGAPKIKVPAQRSGTGFGATAANAGKSPLERLAVAQAKAVRKDGVLRINNALSPESADRLREHVLRQRQIAAATILAEPRRENDDGGGGAASLSKAFYGVENQRKCRCDLQLSLLRGGYAADRRRGHSSGGGGGDATATTATEETHHHGLADSLQELLGVNGSLRYVYEILVTMEGEFYELASVITDPGSARQQIHPDLPFGGDDDGNDAPLYVVFLALQDVNEHMGPTTFLLRTHTRQENDVFSGGDAQQKDDQLRNAAKKSAARIATLRKGDAVLFDARILHCGNANDPLKGSTRALFNFSFRNPKITGNLGYDGSIRPGYVGAMTLRDVGEALAGYEKDRDGDPFAKYSDGLLL